MTDTPIIVNPSAAGAQAGVAIRYAITLVGGYLVAKGWIDGDLVELLATLATVLGPVAYALYRAHQQKKALVTVAAAAPNDVAIIKGEPA